MPEALATTKRKFHKLLDSRFGSPQAISNASPSPSNLAITNSQATFAEPAPKRVRSGTPSLADSLHGRNASHTSLASIRTTGSTRILNKPTPPQPTREPPNFAPWSHDTFLARMRTFSRVTLWHPKPEAVNEVEWAKRGWSCVDTNTVCCKGGCNQRLLVNVEPVPRRRHVPEDLTERKDGASEDQGGSISETEDQDENEEDFEHTLVDRYKTLIIEGHAEGCLWRQVGCKNDIYRLPIVKSTVWQPELRDRFNELIKISTSLQSIRLKPDDFKPSPEKLLADFPDSLLATPNAANESGDDTAEGAAEILPEARPKALLVAMCGWRGVTESGTELFCCDACFQRIGLWMYQPDYKRSTFSDDDDQEQDHSLDLVDLHREHCPWRNPTSQSATGDYAGLPAWQILHNVLYRYADEYRRRSRAKDVIPRPVSQVESVADPEENVDSSLELMPELTREETEHLDKERSSRLKKLKKVFGFKTRIPPTMI